MKQNKQYLTFARQSCILYMILLAWLICFNNYAHAEEEEGEAAAPSYAYVAIEPDIVTNYVNDNSKRLGFLRVTLEIMLESPDKIPTIEHHMPLLRAIVVEILGAQTKDTVSTMTGREEIRREILKRFKDVLLRETGKETVRDVIFTRYLRQGG